MEALKKNHKRILPIKIARKIIIIFVFIFIFDFFLFSAPVLASEGGELANISYEEIILEENDSNSSVEDKIGTLPENKELAVKSVGYHHATAYNSEVGQTDDSPCITANGFNLCEHGIEDTVAANFLPFGAKVRMPDVFGDRVFIVRDRMNSRYTSRLDVWMKDRQSAIKFGVKIVKIEIIE